MLSFFPIDSAKVRRIFSLAKYLTVFNLYSIYVTKAKEISNIRHLNCLADNLYLKLIRMA